MVILNYQNTSLFAINRYTICPFCTLRKIMQK